MVLVYGSVASTCNFCSLCLMSYSVCMYETPIVEKDRAKRVWEGATTGQASEVINVFHTTLNYLYSSQLMRPHPTI